jgi:hypothetical protein
MSEIRLYVDEDAEEMAVVRGLRLRGIDALLTRDVGQLSAVDETQLAFAVSQSRSIYTLNLGDYARLHREYLQAGLNHFGIIVIPEQRYSIGEKIRRIAELVARTSAEEIIDQIVYL